MDKIIKTAKSMSPLHNFWYRWFGFGQYQWFRRLIGGRWYYWHWDRMWQPEPEYKISVKSNLTDVIDYVEEWVDEERGHLVWHDATFVDWETYTVKVRKLTKINSTQDLENL